MDFRHQITSPDGLSGVSCDALVLVATGDSVDTTLGAPLAGALSDAIAHYSTAPAGFDDTRTFLIAFDQGPSEDSALRTVREKAELAALPGAQTVAQIELPPLSRREMPEELISKN